MVSVGDIAQQTTSGVSKRPTSNKVVTKFQARSLSHDMHTSEDSSAVETVSTVIAIGPELSLQTASYQTTDYTAPPTLSTLNTGTSKVTHLSSNDTPIKTASSST